MAELYADLFCDDLEKNDAPAVTMLADLVGQISEIGTTVLDVGCGPGHVTEHLATLGVHAIGIEPSVGLLEQALARFPQRSFCRGDHLALSVATGAAAGLLSRFSTIHKPPSELPPVFAEYARVVAPGGTLALWFFAADDPSEHGDGFDHKVATAYRADVDTMSTMLAEAGFAETNRTFKEMANQRSHAALLATRR